MICAIGASAATGQPDAAARTWRFRVLLDGRHIGEHDFSVVRHGADTVVDSEAHFKVRVAFVPVYHYDQRDHEVWRNGCLAAISSHTEDDGTSSSVQGTLQEDGFHLERRSGGVTLPACIHTYAYWDRALLAAARLLNPQTGEYQATSLSRGTVQDIAVGAQRVPAEHYSLDAPKLAIQLWYSPAGDWLALESKLANGRTLHYELQNP